ncbi:MAG: acyl carrier protein [Vicinamibacterales bacterium]
MADGGLLLLVETTADQAWFDITTGLIEGWQHFDDDLRDGHPLLAADRWISRCWPVASPRRQAWPPDGSAAAAVGQHVIVARRRGVASASEAHVAVPDAARAAADSVALPGVRAAVDAALPAERLDLVRDFVRDAVVRVLRLDPDAPPGGGDRLMDLGCDSLMAVRLRNLLRSGLQLERALPVSLVFDHPTVDDIARVLLTRIDGPPTVTVADSAPAAPAIVGEAAVAAMSDAEVEAMLLERLKPR